MGENNVFNSNDTMDINELASLNDEISPELIEQLQQKLVQENGDMVQPAKESSKPEFDVNDDTTLFEEPITEQAKEEPKKEPPKISKSFDDNFIKKYKAKLNKQQNAGNAEKTEEISISNDAFSDLPHGDDNIEQISDGKITERPLSKSQKEYNDSLDFLDGNVKYSKYVIYIDPQNIDFIDNLTVKERKNLINKILKEQNDISITKKRFRIINSVIRHVLIAVLTLTISIPIIYWTINASLEATINSYRHSQTMFQSLYKENGKITNTNKK